MTPGAVLSLSSHFTVITVVTYWSGVTFLEWKNLREDHRQEPKGNDLEVDEVVVEQKEILVKTNSDFDCGR